MGLLWPRQATLFRGIQRAELAPCKWSASIAQPHRVWASCRTRLGCALAQVEDILLPNVGRYHLNWVKLRVWEWEEYDALILLDADAVVRGSLAHLFSLPTSFAWASQNGHTGFVHNRGGVIMLRPCRVRPHALPAFHATASQHLSFTDSTFVSCTLFRGSTCCCQPPNGFHLC